MVFQVQPCLTINPLTGLSTHKTQQLPNTSTHQPANTRTHKLNNPQPHQIRQHSLLVYPSTCQLGKQRAHQPTVLVNSPTCQPVNLSTRQLSNPPPHHFLSTRQPVNSSTNKPTNSKLKSIFFILQIPSIFHDILAKILTKR